MKSRIATLAIPAGIAALLVLAGPGRAQYSPTGTGRSTSEWPPAPREFGLGSARERTPFSGRPDQGLGSPMQEIRGEILRVQRLRSPETNQEIVAALVQTEDGRQLVVDLGPSRLLRDQQVLLTNGEEIAARGPFVRAGNQRVLLAQEVRADGQTLTVNRRGQPSAQRLQREADLLDEYGHFQGQGMQYGQILGRRMYDDQDQLEGGSFSPYPGQRGQTFGGQYQSPGTQYGIGQREDYYSERTGRQGPETWQQRIRGEIVRTKRVNLPGFEEDSLFALVRPDAGRQALVYLGPVTDLEGVQFHRGEEIEIRGLAVRIHGQPLILAQQFRAQGQTVPIAQLAREELLSPSHQVRGQILRVRTVELPGLTVPLVFAQVRPEQGRPTLVFLGSTPDLQGIQLNRGEEVEVRGWAFQVGNNRILLAQQLRADGETIPIGDQLQRQGSYWQEPSGTRTPSYRRTRTLQPRTIELTAQGYEFEPVTMTARPGEELDVVLINRGNKPHSVVFDLPGLQHGMQRPLQPGETKTLAIRAPDRPGRYVFYCPVDDDRQRGMEGELIVTERY